MHSKFFFLRLLGCFAAVSLSVLTLQAQEEEPQEQQDWTNPSGGSFGDAGNWDGGVPQPGDLGWFNLSQAGYMVNLDGSRSVGALQVANDSVVLNLDGYTLNLTDPSSVSTAPNNTDPYWNASVNTFQGVTALMVGRGFEETTHLGSLTINGGGVVNTEGLTLGGTNTSSGTLIVEGAGTILNVTGDSLNNTILGFRGDGDMVIRQGAQVNFDGQVTMVRHSGATADLRIEDEGTRVNFTYFNIGHRGKGSVYVGNGAELIGGSGSSGRIQLGARASGSAMVVDNGRVVAGDVTVGYSSTSNGQLEVINGGTMALTGILRVAQNANSNAAVTVDGEGSSLSVSSSVQLAGNTSAELGTAALNVRNGGAFSTDSIIYAWSQSTIAVDGGTLSAAQLRGVADATLDVTLNSGEFGPLITVTGPAASTIDDMILQVALGDQFTASVGDVFVLLDYSALTGTFADYADEDQIEVGGYVFDISYGSGTDGVVSLSVSAIPEPATVALIFALLTLGVAVTLRRSNRK